MSEIAQDTECRFRPAGAVRASVDRKLRVLAVPFGGPDDLDHLNEWMDKDTETWMKVGRTIPVTYFHGFTPDKKMTPRPNTIGEATVTGMDSEGWWMEVDLDEGRMGDKMLQRAEQGTCRASTGAINYLCRPVDVPRFHKEPIYVEAWIVGELSLIDEGLGRHPVNDKAVALPLRAMYEAQELEFPKEFGENSEPEPAVSNPTTEFVGDTKMAEIEVPVEEPKEPVTPPPIKAKAEVDEPKRRAVFNIAKETIGEPADNDKKESWEWFWHIRHGITKGPSMRVLEEHEAAEGLPLVPPAALADIIAQRDELSVVSRGGFTRYKTDKQIFNIPREVTKATAMALIAEEGAYVVNEPVFGLLAITTLKYGSMMGATEELLEDQNLFIPWFTKACGRMWARTENAQFYTTMDVAGNGTVTGAASDTLTWAEFNTWFWGLESQYREGAQIIMNQGTMAALNQLLIATPYAFPEPNSSRNVFGLPSVWGTPIHLVNDWIIYTGAAALGLVLSHVHPDYAGIVERRGMTIKVDPYGLAATGIIRYFPSVRFAPFVTQALAHSVKNGA